MAYKIKNNLKDKALKNLYLLEEKTNYKNKKLGKVIDDLQKLNFKEKKRRIK